MKVRFQIAPSGMPFCIGTLARERPLPVKEGNKYTTLTTWASTGYSCWLSEHVVEASPGEVL
jgi:hypothetical protein